MTRKRFIKLMMSRGYQSRSSKTLVSLALMCYGNYQKAYDDLYGKNADIPLLLPSSIATPIINEVTDFLEKSNRALKLESRIIDKFNNARSEVWEYEN